MDCAEACTLHQGNARPYCPQQAEPRALHNHAYDQGALFEVQVGKIQERFGKELVSQIEEACREKVDCKEAHFHLFANEESWLVLKDERSS